MEVVADDPAPGGGHIVEAQGLEVRQPAALQVCEERIGPEFAFRTEREMTGGRAQRRSSSSRDNPSQLPVSFRSCRETKLRTSSGRMG